MKQYLGGLGLLEVLLAAAIVGLSFSSLAQHYARSLQHQTANHAQRIAMRIAEQKLEDLHDFNQLQTYPEFDFSDIADNQGGKLENGKLLLPAGKVANQWTQGSS